jgi:hypothetical protein
MPPGYIHVPYLHNFPPFGRASQAAGVVLGGRQECRDGLQRCYDSEVSPTQARSFGFVLICGLGSRDRKDREALSRLTAEAYITLRDWWQDVLLSLFLASADVRFS